jgi:Endosomal/lysosomal potassium channel TMEM175
MSEPYNRFTGQSLEYLTALSDGLFAVAMTLLVLHLRVPGLTNRPAHRRAPGGPGGAGTSGPYAVTAVTA